MGSCNGLICMGNQLGSICIWNPETGESKVKPISEWKFYTESHYDVRYGFGYDCRLDDYKLVRIAAALHWASSVKAINSNVIVSFDVTSETFVEFVYPEEHRLAQQGKYDFVGLLEDRLCLIVFHGIVRRNGIWVMPYTDIWVMQYYGVRESWTKQFSLTAHTFFDVDPLKLA
ncbi:F-box/kelch-repeat protein At3g06240-like [Papaver somniferum]|uniref:F-box/kelch-repeat protein At3g06240-like n=1 Tax=Papaver somniferum TaxID=3469 RepID=UPI000E700E9C|nr:F-box/kelch-repeat protein At3g06240-like [Papaver somniferum]